MILCGNTTAGTGERDGAGAGSPSGRKAGGRRRRVERVNKSRVYYVKINNGS